jgi:aspartate ammonia-lyase
MACFHVIGNDQAIMMCAEAGQFELNVFGPLATYSILDSLEVLSRALEIFTRRCITGIRPNRNKLEYYFEHSPSIATALAPILGYARTAKLVKEAEKKDISIRELAIREGLFTENELDRILNPLKLTRPNLPLGKGKK